MAVARQGPISENALLTSTLCPCTLNISCFTCSRCLAGPQSCRCEEWTSSYTGTQAVFVEYICTLLFVYVATSAVTSGCHTKDVAAASGNNADLAKGAFCSVAEHKALYMSYISI